MLRQAGTHARTHSSSARVTHQSSHFHFLKTIRYECSNSLSKKKKKKKPPRAMEMEIFHDSIHIDYLYIYCVRFLFAGLWYYYYFFWKRVEVLVTEGTVNKRTQGSILSDSCIALSRDLQVRVRECLICVLSFFIPVCTNLGLWSLCHGFWIILCSAGGRLSVAILLLLHISFGKNEQIWSIIAQSAVNVFDWMISTKMVRSAHGFRQGLDRVNFGLIVYYV